jgi:RNA polymerase sigma factor (sigma-70 family)
MNEDAALLRRYAETRAEDAFGELVRRHLDLVYGAALRRVGGDAHLAEDVSQQVFTALARQAVALAHRPVLAGWLYTTTRYAAARTVRAERRRHVREQEAHAMQQLTSDSAGAVDWDRLRPVLDEAMDNLSDRDREAVLLRFFQGQAFAEVGAKLQVSEDAARMRVDRALDKLRALLVRRGITSTSAALAMALANSAAAAVPPAGLAASVTGAALAGAATVSSGATTALALWNLMSTTKTAVGVAGVIALLAVGLATREVLASRDAEASLAVATRSYHVAAARLTSLRQRVQAAEQEAARLQQAVDAARAAQAMAASAQSTAEATAWNPREEGRAFVARHPEVKRALVDFNIAQMDRKYGRLYQALGFTSEQIREFQSLRLATTRHSYMDSEAGMKRYLLPLGEGDLTETEVKDRLSSLLGSEGNRLIQEYDRAAPVRSVVEQVASAVCFAENPLDVEQANRLAQILDANRSNEKGQGFDWDMVLAQIHGVLAPAQLEVLIGLRAQERIDRLRQEATSTQSQSSPAAPSARPSAP